MNSATLTRVWAACQTAAYFAEQVIGAGNGEEKKEMAVSLVNETLNLPILNETQEAYLIGMLIELVVSQFNARGWTLDALATPKKVADPRAAADRARAAAVAARQ